MNIGKEERTHRIEPARVPVPAREPKKTPGKIEPKRAPVTTPAPVKVPQKAGAR